MLRTIKPRNARSKRALEAREPKEIEDARTAIFVKGTHTGEKVSAAMKDLMALKRPAAISFSKKNVIRPFEDASSLEFWAAKNDASLFVIGQSTKKRPDGMTFVRMFDGKVLDMVELGLTEFKGMDAFKTAKASPGHRPLLHFASPLFDSHPRYIQLKSLFIDFFNGQVVDSICLPGIEHVISFTTAPIPDSLALDLGEGATYPPPGSEGVLGRQDMGSGAGAGAGGAGGDSTTANLPPVHIRSYSLTLSRSISLTTAHPHTSAPSQPPTPSQIPTISLTPTGPSLDLVLRRNVYPSPSVYAVATKRPKMGKREVEKGVGRKKKNVGVDEMGDVRGRIHVGLQDLSGLRGKRVKALRGSRRDIGGGGEEECSGDEGEGEGDDEGRGGRGAKRRKVD